MFSSTCSIRVIGIAVHPSQKKGCGKLTHTDLASTHFCSVAITQEALIGFLTYSSIRWCLPAGGLFPKLAEAPRSARILGICPRGQSHLCRGTSSRIPSSSSCTLDSSALHCPCDALDGGCTGGEREVCVWEGVTGCVPL